MAVHEQFSVMSDNRSRWTAAVASGWWGVNLRYLVGEGRPFILDLGMCSRYESSWGHVVCCAGVVELADTRDLKSLGGFPRTGSIPVPGTYSRRGA